MPAFYLDSKTPEISIGVQTEARGLGVGSAMLDALIVEVKRRGIGLILNVRDNSPAIRLYGRAGFVRLPGRVIRNRTGGLSIALALGPQG